MINPKHPRAKSLQTRERIVKGVGVGITSLNGLIAQGRGEAFDYLLGEKTHGFAKQAIRAAAATLLLAEFPVLSVNGNTAVLTPKEYIELSNILDCPIEVNLFHRTLAREKKIQNCLKELGAKNVVGVGENASVEIKNIASKRKFVSPHGIEKADVVLVPLEDGDRTGVLVKMGKKVITIDLNPLSRTAKKASITIIDNIIRAFPLLVKEVKKLKKLSKNELKTLVAEYENKEILQEAVGALRASKMV